MRTRSQKYAAPIFQQVSGIAAMYPLGNAYSAQENEEHQKQRQKYGSMAHKLPVLIRTAGLTQALAFVDARPDAAQQEILSHLAETIGIGRDQLLTRSREDTVGDYMQLTQQVLDALLWYKRFAQSILKVELSEGAGGQGGEE